MPKLRMAPLMTGIAAIALVPSAHAEDDRPPIYTITDLGPLDGTQSSSVALNASGQTIGYSGATLQLPTLWTKGAPSAIEW